MAAHHHFGKRSVGRLNTCDPRLIEVVTETLKVVPFDLTVLCGHRTREEQDKAVRDGRSKAPWPKSKHNTSPSVAVDVAPYPIDWNDLYRFAYLAGAMQAVAAARGVKLRWGGNFDRDGEIYEQKFIDAPHYEIDE